MDDETNEPSRTPEPSQPGWMVPSLWIGAALMAIVLLAVLRAF